MIAKFIVGQRVTTPITHTWQLMRLVFNAKGLTENTWEKKRKGQQFGGSHPAARTFQAIRILVNNELGVLKKLLDDAGACLRPGGKIAVISFHDGEDNMVRQAFRDGYNAGVYEEFTGTPIKPQRQEVMKNPRSSSAMLRWARKAK
jgi:16S rRNA (cytosine1402-N4)-methyltransferase